ncbi:MAG: glycosyltransferase [Candidatus Bathyarchaeia archaeon]
MVVATKMFWILLLWVTSVVFSLGSIVLIFAFMKIAAKKPWNIKIDKNYKPKVSIIIPTYNEGKIILFKLKNLVKVNYPRNLMQIIIVDSNSEDDTIEVIDNFINQNPQLNIEVLVEGEKKGKSTALNSALKKCYGEVVIVSDADCFWPSDILEQALPFLTDPKVGALSGPKILLNPKQSWITETENTYVNLHNQVKLGESKIHSTVFFEGGFAVYKRELLDSFDPHNTGSDDSGTIIKVIEKNFRAILVPEAKFYSAFPLTWKEKINIKTRRANQLVRVFIVYAKFLFLGKIKNKSRKVIIQNVLLYLINPIMFVLFLITTFLLILQIPYLAIIFLPLLFPTLRVRIFEITQNYLILFLSIFSILLGRKFTFWNKPKDRALITYEILSKNMLV